MEQQDNEIVPAFARPVLSPSCEVHFGRPLLAAPVLDMLWKSSDVIMRCQDGRSALKDLSLVS